jgi:hypothetical protein
LATPKAISPLISVRDAVPSDATLEDDGLFFMVYDDLKGLATDYMACQRLRCGVELATQKDTSPRAFDLELSHVTMCATPGRGTPAGK